MQKIVNQHKTLGLIKRNLLLLIGLILIGCKLPENSITFQSMDTAMTIKSFGKNSKKANLQAQKRIQELDKILSSVDSQSQLYSLNHACGKEFTSGPELEKLIRYGLEKAEESQGAFNPLIFPLIYEWGFTSKNYKVPSDQKIQDLLAFTDYKKVSFEDGKIILPEGMAFDFGALGKGFAGDCAIEILKENGVESAILDLGGNIQLLGKKESGENWKIGLRNPWGGTDPSAIVKGSVPLVLELNDCAVITSGGYERYFTADDGKKYIHILDGRSGYPVDNEIASSTIVAKEGLYADYLSTTSFILGKEKTLQYWRQAGDFDFIMIFTDGSISYTSGLKDKLTLLEKFTSVEVIEK
ncbi:MAG: FAD:protein FMN transferase [Treponema sp.]|nr:FAD:protein FMN transferase [Treponema sp.]